MGRPRFPKYFSRPSQRVYLKPTMKKATLKAYLDRLEEKIDFCVSIIGARPVPFINELGVKETKTMPGEYIFEEWKKVRHENVHRMINEMAAKKRQEKAGEPKKKIIKSKNNITKKP